MVRFSNSNYSLENPSKIQPGKCTWKSPSNIAIVKYWGKHGNQLPKNPSISLTLSEAHTATTVSYGPRKSNGDKFDFSFSFEGRENKAFHDKIKQNFNKLSSIFPFLTQVSLKIQSHNSFPHSSGIASSASSMSALALCLCEIENNLFSNLNDQDEFLVKASFVSRLCSGSACRSIYPYVGLWGKTDYVENSSDYFAVDIHKDVHEVFQKFHDDILIISDEEKSVSSTAGHQLMDSNIFASSRYDQARKNIGELYSIMKTGDLEAFGEIAESEALTLHALMMCSSPSYMLMKPDTLKLIEKIRSFRNNNKIPIYFTLDAGPNLHVLYPDDVYNEVKGFIDQELKPYCKEEKIIYDVTGSGPLKIEK